MPQRIIRIRLPISNVFLVLGERPALIDAGRPRDLGRIVAELARHGVRPRDLALILLSHAHWDHVGAAATMRALSGAPVAIHRADVEPLRRGSHRPYRGLQWSGRILKPLLPSRFPALEPDLILEGADDLSRFGFAAEIVPLPGHTAGSIGIFFADRSAMVGDTVFGGYLGGWIRPSHANLHYFAEDAGELARSLQELESRRPTALHVGHGGPVAGDGFRRRLPALLRAITISH